MASKMSKRASQSMHLSACSKCGKNVFQLEKMLVDNLVLHESCFICSTCQLRLTSSNYVMVDGDYYCTKDSHAAKHDKKTTNPNNNTEQTTGTKSADGCSLCATPISKDDSIFLNEGEQVHRNCFVCFECKTALHVGNYHNTAGKFYCQQHFAGGGRKPNLLRAGLDDDPLQDSMLDLVSKEKNLFRSNSILMKKELDEKKGLPFIANPILEPVGHTAFSDNDPTYSSGENGLTDEADNGTRKEEESLKPSGSELSESSHTHITENDSDSKMGLKIGDRTSDTSETEYLDSEEKLEDLVPLPNRIVARTIAVPIRPVTSDITDDRKKKRSKKKEFPKFGKKDKEKDKDKDKDKEKDIEAEDSYKKRPNSSRRRKKGDKSDRSERSEKSETEEGSEKIKSSGSHKSKRKKVTPRKTKEKEGETPEDQGEDGDKKKKGKRGLFSLRKEKKKKVEPKRLQDSEDKAVNTSSPSLTSFVSSRFRKIKKESPSEKEVLVDIQGEGRSAPEGEGIPVIRTQTEDFLEPLLSRNDSDSRNIIARLGSSSRVDSPKRQRKDKEMENQKDVQDVAQSILPMVIDTPDSPATALCLDLCSTALEEDILLVDLSLPTAAPTDTPYTWKSYELKRELSPVIIQLPDDIIPRPTEIKEKILQTGFFERTTIHYGIVGASQRLLEYFSILKSTYPFSTELVGASNSVPASLLVLTERNDLEIESQPLDTLLSNPSIEWILIDSKYSVRADHIKAALHAGKNVFCERPVCFSMKECLEMKEAHENSGKQFLHGAFWSHVPFYSEICTVLRSGVLGSMVSVELNHLLSVSEGGLLMCSWMRLKEDGKTSLFDTFTNEIGMLNWLLDSVPSRVSSFSGLDIFVEANKPERKKDLRSYLDWSVRPFDLEEGVDPFTSKKDVEDNHVIALEYRNHVRATCHINTNSAFPQKRILLCGTKGTLEGDLYTGTIRFKIIGEQETNIVQVTPGAGKRGDQLAMEEIVASTGNPSADTSAFEGLDFLPSIISTLGVHRSKEEGSIIDLEPQWKQLGI